MPATSYPRPQFSDVEDHASAIAGATLLAEPIVPAPPLTPAATAGAAHRAVHAVLEATERITPGNSRAVNLQFSVAGSDLAVRIELHEGEMRATFRTDSAELRTALAREWQAVSEGAGGHLLRAVEPVFAPAKASGLDTSSRENNFQQHRDPGARQFDQPTPGGGPRPGVTSFSPAPSSGPRESRRAARPGNRWLHTFA